MVRVNPNDARRISTSKAENLSVREQLDQQASRINDALTTGDINEGITNVFDILLQNPNTTVRLGALKTVYSQLDSPEKRNALYRAIAERDGTLLPETDLKNFEAWMRKTTGFFSPVISPFTGRVEQKGVGKAGPRETITRNIAEQLWAENLGMRETVEEGEWICREGERGEYVYFILEGRVNGVRKSLVQPPASGMFGEEDALAGNERRTWNYEAFGGRATILRIDWRTLKGWLERHPELQADFANIATRNTMMRVLPQVQVFSLPIERMFQAEAPEQRAAAGQEGSLDIGTSPILSARELLKIYHSSGEGGVKERFTSYFIDLAMHGYPQGLQLWYRLAVESGGEPSYRDMVTLLEYVEKGQTHIHPMRSLPIDYIYNLGRAQLDYTEVWEEGEKRINEDLRYTLEKHGYATLRDVFADSDRRRAEAALRDLISYQPEGQSSLNEYLARLSPSFLVKEPVAIKGAAGALALSQYRDGVRYLELRFSLFKPGISTADVETVIRSYIDGLHNAMGLSPDLEARAILSFDTTMTREETADLASKIETVLSKPGNRDLLEAIVGLDTCGPEVESARLGDYVLDGQGNRRYYFNLDKMGTILHRLAGRLTELKGGNSRVNLTIHAGENFLSVEQGFESIERAIGWGARRIGHGVILGVDLDYMAEQCRQGRTMRDSLGKEYTLARIERLRSWQKELSARVRHEHIVIEACPTSNTHTTTGMTYKTHPVAWFRKNGIAFTISIDNGATDIARASGELAAISSHQGLSLKEILEMCEASSIYRLDELGPDRSYFAGMTQEEMSLSIYDRAYAGRDLFVSEIPGAVAELVQQHGSTYTEVGFFDVRGNNAVLVSSNSGHLIPGVTIDIRNKNFDQISRELSELKLLNGRSECLRFVPVEGKSGELMGILSIGGDRNINIDNVRGFTASIAGALTINEQFRGYRTNGLGMSTSASFIRDAEIVLTRRGPVQTLVVNMSLKAVNALPLKGHDAGNDVMRIARNAVRRVCSRHGIPVEVTKEGANLAAMVDIAPVDQAGFMAEVQTEISRSVSRYLRRMGASAEVISEASRRVAVGILDYNPQRDGATAAGDLWVAVKDMIARLNVRSSQTRGVPEPMVVTLETGRIAEIRSTMVGRNINYFPEFVAKQRDLRAAFEGIEAQVAGGVAEGTPRKVISGIARNMFDARYLERDTGLPKHTFLDEYVSNLAPGRTYSAAFFDLNKTSAFSGTFGNEGHRIIDAIMMQRVGSDIATALYEKFNGEIVLVRHTERSEEFYLAGEVAPEKMREAMRMVGEMMSAPFIMELDVKVLMNTPEGREYIEKFQPAVKNGMVSVDVTQLGRTSEGVTYKGITLSGAFGQIRNEADMKAVIREGERAKSLNPERNRNMVLSPEDATRQAELEQRQRAETEGRQLTELRQRQQVELDRALKSLAERHGNAVAENVRAIMELATPENINMLEQRLASGIARLTPKQLAQEFNIEEVKAAEIINQANRTIIARSGGQFLSSIVGFIGMNKTGEVLARYAPDINPAFHFAITCYAGHYISSGTYAIAEKLLTGSVTMENLGWKAGVRSLNPLNVGMGMDMTIANTWNLLFQAVGDRVLKRAGVSESTRAKVQTYGYNAAFMSSGAYRALATYLGKYGVNILPAAGTRTATFGTAVGAFAMTNFAFGLYGAGLQHAYLGSYGSWVLGRAADAYVADMASTGRLMQGVLLIKRTTDFFGAKAYTDIFYAPPAFYDRILAEDQKTARDYATNFRRDIGEVIFNEATRGVLGKGNMSQITPQNREMIRMLVKAAVLNLLRDQQHATQFVQAQGFLRLYTSANYSEIPKELIGLDLRNLDTFQPSDALVEWAVRTATVPR